MDDGNGGKMLFSIIVIIIDFNDEVFIFNSVFYNGYVMENVVIGFFVMIVIVLDGDVVDSLLVYLLLGINSLYFIVIGSGLI